MKSETRQCQNCSLSFSITPEDLTFYEKIKVPPPTFCPECRAIRRMTWRNERSLYKRACDLCKKNIISIYPEGSIFPVYCQSCWWSDSWDAGEYAREYDFNKNFFEQWQELFNSVPHLALFNASAIESDYCNYFGGAKKCYLATAGRESENLIYTNRVSHSKDSADCYTGNKLELCYGNVLCNNSYKLNYSRFCDDCTESDFLYDCKNCSNCFGCTSLRNAEYCMWNERLTKEEYKRRRSEIDLGSFKVFNEMNTRFESLYYQTIHKYARLLNCIESTGDNLHNTNKCHDCFDMIGKGSENCRYCTFIVVGGNDCYDVYGAPKAELLYEALAIGFDSNENSMNLFSSFIRGSSFIYYSENCASSHNLFGCIGLKKKEYRILNKEYSKTDYEMLASRIIEYMNNSPFVDSGGRVYRYGEFFPSELSPFAYNESIAQEYFPLSASEAQAKGYKWKAKEVTSYQVTKKNNELPDNIKDVSDTILNDIIECAYLGECNDQCSSAFKITPNELAFYRNLNIALPRLCPNCRHYERLRRRNPLKLWERNCMCNSKNDYMNTVPHAHSTAPCVNDFYTSYSPERKEVVYCEACYQKEIS